MELSLAEALGIFHGWNDSTAAVTLFLEDADALVRVSGIVTGVVEDEIVVSNEASRVRLALKNAQFEYKDLQNAPDFLRDAAGSDFVCCIEVCSRSNSRCFLFELPAAGPLHPS